MNKAIVKQDTLPASSGFFSFVWQGDLRFLCLLAAVIIYGLFGTPTPEQAGGTEALIALLLVAACGGWQILGLFRSRTPLASWQKAGLVFFLYGLTVPLAGALIAGNDIRLIIRDIIPFFFLLLPIFLKVLFSEALFLEGKAQGPKTLKLWSLTGAVMIAGAAMAARALLRPLCERRANEGICDYISVSDAFLANSPLVLTAFLLLISLAGLCLYYGGRKYLYLAAFAAAGAVIPLAAMILALQRASLALSVLVITLLMLGGVRRRPLRMIAPLFLLLLLGWLGREPLLTAGATLMEKNSLVGANMRGQEAAAVIGALADSLPAILFGRGWGAEFVSPAVGGLRVNFTHSLFTTYFLKSGLVGLILAGFYLGAIASQLWRVIRGWPVIGLALAAPFIIDLFLYASFKGLGFGILLTLILLWADSCGQLHQAAGCSRNQEFRKQ